MISPGDKFNLLTVIKRSDEKFKDGHVRWICQCDCGNIVAIASHRIKKTLSCGCARIGVNLKDLKGQRFGRLVVLYRTDKHSGNSVVWLCQCDCGKIAEISSRSLVEGYTKSCGCLASEIHRNAVVSALKIRSETYCDGTDVLALKRIVAGNVTSNNTTGYTGVSYDKSVGLYKAYIVFKRHRYYLGGSKKIDVCIQLRNEAEKHKFVDFLKWYEENKKASKE